MTLSLSLALALLPGCADPAKDGGDSDTPAANLRVDSFEARSDAEGIVEIEVEVAEGERFQVIVGRDRGYLSTDYILAPDGSAALDWEDWYESADSLTESYWPTEFATTANWPVREQDGPLSAGTWRLQIATLNGALEYVGDQDVNVEVLLRKDAALAEGRMKAVVAYAGELGEDEEVVSGTEAAVAYWQELYARYGVTLEVEYDTIDADAELPDTYEGLEAVTAFHAAREERVMLVVIGETIANDTWIYGEAGGIPGPFGAYPHAAVFASWIANAGADGRFSERDVLLYGETLAHEVGHFVGLFHPVEDGWEYWDALDDTEDCGGMVPCENNLGANLMFPYPLCYGTDCTRQDNLSGGQIGVAQRYLGVE
jgi:hypothetical protein